MLEEHTTRDGETMLIAQMEDSHLINFINLILNKIEEYQRAMGDLGKESAYHKKLYGIRTITETEAAEITRAAVRKLYPYLAEALLRESVSEVVQKRLAKVLGRNGALPRENRDLILPSKGTLIIYPEPDEIDNDDGIFEPW